MISKEFIEKYLGKFVDFDGYYGAQCVDLIQQYNKEVYNGGFIPGAAAADIWETYPTDIYDRVLNTIDAIPVMGDVAIWKKSTSLPWGHIAIVSSANQLKFTSLDQNWPTGSACKYVEHNYNEVIGWLHPKALPNTDICKPFKDDISFKDGVIGKRDITISNLVNEKSLLQSQYNTLELSLQEIQKQSNIYKIEYERANSPTGYKTQIEELTRQKASWIEQEKTFNRSLAQYKYKLDTIKSPIKKILSQILDELKALTGNKS